MNKKQKLILKIVTLIFFACAVFIIVWFTGKTGEESNATSQWLAGKIENFVGKHFTIKRSDFFWRSTLNAILRKVGHFVEFSFLGMTASAFFILIFRRKWLSALLSVGICSMMAFADEFRQFSVSGRNPQWFDVKLDIAGAILGIIIVFAVWSIYSRLMTYKKRILELEQMVRNQHLEK